MDLLKCPHCPYTTTIKCNYKRHLNRKISCKNIPKSNENAIDTHKNAIDTHKNAIDINKNAIDINKNAIDINKNAIDIKTTNKLTCNQCGKILSSKQGLKYHTQICKGVDALTCPVCRKSFAHRNYKYAHMKTGKCIPVQPQASTINNTTNNNNITNNNTTNNTTNITNNNNQQNIIQHIHINAFGKEDLKYIIEDPAFLKKCIRNKEEGLLECIKRIHFNQEKPENMNIRKQNKKDGFVDVYNGHDWTIRMTDKATHRIMTNIESIFTDYLDDMYENHSEEWQASKRSLNSFLNSVSSLLEWEFNNIENDRNRNTEQRKVFEQQRERFQHNLNKMITETIYRESIRKQ